MSGPASLYARLPSVERVLAGGDGLALLAAFARPAVTEAVRLAIDGLRERIKLGQVLDDCDLDAAAVAAAARTRLEAMSRSRLRPVVNATGVVVHTNLGRALLAPSAIEALTAAASAPCNLEYDVAAGGRGDRDELVEEHLCALTGAEAATVVNNNAAAVILVLNSLAEGRGVVVSRGELIEIGGSFRIPDIMAKSGARLHEVGTTNRTHASDYEKAAGGDTALLLKVHTSNYRIVGFSSAVELEQLAAIAAAERRIRTERGAAAPNAVCTDATGPDPVAGSAHPARSGLGDGLDRSCGSGPYVFEDLGAGALIDLSRWGLPAEPVVADRLAAGADLVSFSGDKLLGGPQCGVIVGRRELIELVRRNPLKRALRCDKMTLAALEATLRIYRFDPAVETTLPTLRLLLRSREELRELGRLAAERLSEALGGAYSVCLEDSEAQVGSGAQPQVSLPSVALSVTSPGNSPDAIAARFRRGDRAIVGRIEKDRFLLDLRAVEDLEDIVPA